jgi:hypothetical protein
MALLASDMGHKTNATGIVFAGRRIQTVVLKMLDFGSRSHGALLKVRMDTEPTAVQQKLQAL